MVGLIGTREKVAAVVDRPNPASPLTLTVSPTLDAAVQAGWEAWEGASREAGAELVAAWMGRRAGAPDLS